MDDDLLQLARSVLRKDRVPTKALARIGSRAQLLTLDREAVRDMFPGQRHTQALVRRLQVRCGGPEFAAHRRWVPGSLLSEHPVLRRWPPCVARWLHTHVADREDRAHLLAWMGVVCQAHVSRVSEHRAARTVASHARFALRLFNLVRRAKGVDTAYRDALPFDMDLAGLRRLFTRLLALWRKHPSSGRPRTASMPEASDAVRTLLAPIRSAIRHGVFPRIHPQSGAAGFTVDALRAEEEDDDDHHDEDHSGLRHRGVSKPISDAEVEALLEAARSCVVSKALVCLLSTVAPRIHAISRLRVVDVWDDAEEGGRVRDRWCFDEKGGTTRWVFPRETLRTAMHDLLRTRSAGLMYVFGHADGRPRSVNGLVNLLHRICNRAGVRRINPHAFRSFVVNHGIQGGASLEEMSRYLGHAAVTTTARFYWTEDVHARVNKILDGPPVIQSGGDLTALRNDVTMAHRELVALRADHKRR